MPSRLHWPKKGHFLALAGFAMIGFGGILPWADTYLPVKVYILGMESGLERVWVRRLLVIAGTGLLVEIINLRTERWRPVLSLKVLILGGVIASITVLTSPLTSRWAPEPGVYITLLGSILVALGALINLIRVGAGDPLTLLWPDDWI